METKAIVFTYTGQTVSRETLGKMVIALAEDTEISGDVNTHCFNSDDIAKSIVNTIKSNNNIKSPYTDEELAFVYIAEKIKYVTKWPFKLFCGMVSDVLDYNDKRLTTALKILGNTGHLNIRKELLEKYEFTGCASQIGFLKTLGRNV